MKALLTTSLLATATCALAQRSTPHELSENIYAIKKYYLQHVVHNPADKTKEPGDNSLARFNRWFHLAEPRCYPTGDLPKPSVILKETEKALANQNKKALKTTVAPWQPMGPTDIPEGFFGIGRINCIAVHPTDTSKLYVGAACGGVWKSTNSGASWTTTSANFPSLSIADIAINPKHPDTMYVATGDGYGYETSTSGTYDIFWGGLYSAGVMKSTDGGTTWTTTGLSYIQSNREMIQKLLIHPDNPNILLAATRNGIYRTTNSGTTWTVVDTGHVFSMAFRPGRPDTVYAVNSNHLRISYNAGATWTTRQMFVSTGGRSSLAVSAAAPTNLWILDDNNNFRVSTNEGSTFSTRTSPDFVASFYGYYDRVLAVSPSDPDNIYAFGLDMAVSHDGGFTWDPFDMTGTIHPDHHAVAFNPRDPSVVYNGNDGGVFVTRDAGSSWSFINNGLMISQVYRMSSSRQTPGMLLTGLQDNGSFFRDGSTWHTANTPLGDGMDNAIHPLDQDVQIASTQYGNFHVSTDGGASFTPIFFPAFGTWITPVVLHPRSADTMYFGFDNIYASYNRGVSAVPLTTTPLFTDGAISMAIAPANPKVLYAADHGTIFRSTNGGVAWTNVTAGLPSATYAITGIAVDYKNPNLVYVSLSGYGAGSKVYYSTAGGTGWTSISSGLPNLPVNCVATDSSSKGGLFVGTDIGVYYRDSSALAWAPYSTGLPNVIIDDIDINYTNKKIRVATYGRGIWECNLKSVPAPGNVAGLPASSIHLYPNPASTSWTITFDKKPAAYTIKLTDATGKLLHSQKDDPLVDAAGLPAGLYVIEVNDGKTVSSLKAVKK